MMRSYWFSPGGFASAEPASSSAPKMDSKAQLMCFEERFKPQISVGQHFDAPSFTSKQCFHTNFTRGCLENFTWSTRGREERERACGAGPIEKTLKF